MTLKNSLRLRQEILDKIKRQVQLYLTKESSDLRKYALAYKKNIERTRWTVSSMEEIFTKIETSDIVFGGDFHAFAQAQKAHLRILRSIPPERKVYLCLECFSSQSQKHVSDYIDGRISEELLLKRTKWVENWGFAWAHYKPLVEIIKQRKGECIGLNTHMSQRSGKNLRLRDQHAAGILAKIFKQKKENDLIYVIYGDLHMAQEHLPGDVQKKTNGAARAITLYLNPEKIYFQWIRKGLDRAGAVLKLSSREFCLMESPPWVKWQSYLLFLEETLDRSIDDEDRHFNYADVVTSHMKLMAADLILPLAQVPNLDHVYSYGDEDFLDLLDEKLNIQEFRMLESAVTLGMNFYWMEMAYLSRGTVNYAAHLAGLILHAQVCQRKDHFWQLPKYFCQQIWMEAMAFFLSKIVNPHRKATSLNDLKKQLAVFSPDNESDEPLKIALDQKMYELMVVYGRNKRKSKMKKRTAVSYLKAAQILGAMLGEKIFSNYKTGRLSRSLILEWLSAPMEGEKFDTLYYQRLKEIDKIELGDMNERD